MSLIRCKAIRWALALVLVAGVACARPDDPAPGDVRRSASPLADPTTEVRPGIDVLLVDSLHLVFGRRVGLITNRSGVTSDGRSSIDVLHEHPDVELAALFAPEHGIRGTEAEGRRLEDGIDEASDVVIYSIYGETLAPTPEMLTSIDVLLFDLQDIGARYYTYISTMAYSMRAAGAAGLPFVVLDRPNPIGAPVQGPVLDPAFSSFVGLYPIPVRHGMTAGELARLFVGEFGIDVDLTVVPVAGWTRDAWFDDTGLPWIPPSLNMPTLESASHYPGTCLFEGTNLSVGRGTAAAFQQIGAPWLSGSDLAERMGRHDLPGVRIEAVEFTPDDPSDGKFDGQPVRGIRLRVTDRSTYDPVRTAVAALLEARALSGEAWKWNVRHFDRLAGNDTLRLSVESGMTLSEIVTAWGPGLARFARLRAPYLIYPERSTERGDR